jgi:competence protein ComEC
MKVARDIAGLAVPYAAGTAFAAWASHFLCRCPHISSLVIYTAIIISSAVLLAPKHHTKPSWVLRTAICICLCSCGLLCGMTAEILSVGKPYLGIFMEKIGELGSNTGRFIDSIDFRNTETNAIIKALVIGERTDIPEHITKAFRESGASHILALSGLHLGIIYGILAWISSIFGNAPHTKSIKSVFIVMTCGLYTLATGAGPSIVRAFIFILIRETAKVTGRSGTLTSVLMVSLMIHLTVDPHALREVGFQLSYAAICGIAFIFPWLRDFWPKKDGGFKGPLRWIWETATLSISCQIATGPIAWLYFRSFPIHFLLTNLIALPLTGLIIPASLLTLCLHAFGICPDILLRATEMLVTALSEALTIISLM